MFGQAKLIEQFYFYVLAAIFIACMFIHTAIAQAPMEPVDPDGLNIGVSQTPTNECGANLVAPFAVRRALAAYRNTDAFRECSIAARALNSLAATCGRPE